LLHILYAKNHENQNSWLLYIDYGQDWPDRRFLFTGTIKYCPKSKFLVDTALTIYFFAIVADQIS